ncbi:MAG TPA: VWA domain-containing protein, partial [Longimicrobiales bacterium]|nr:VWA domain-containing protein [Longimicrobiales bacterium]
MKTTVLLDHEPVADGGWMVHALLRLEGEVPANRDRVPLNLSLVLDRSGSMQGEKLHAARQAAAMLTRRLAPEDTVSVVAFDDAVDVVAHPATGDAQEHLPALIESIACGGTTNLSGGWLRGRDLVADNLRDGGINRVILLTDGQANVGLTDPDQLIGLSRTGTQKGISTTTIGFGQGYDEDLLRAMADAGQGGTYYIEKVDQASGVFEEELEGLLSIAAQNVRVTVTPGADADFVKVLHDYPSHAQDDVLTLEVGDLYAREPRRILMAFLIPPDGPGLNAVADVAQLTVTAHVITDEGGVELHEITLPVTLSPTEGGKAEPEIRKEILLVEAARLRQQALSARDRGDYDAAVSLLTSYRGMVENSGVADAAVAEEVRDLELMAAPFHERQVSEADVKYMKQRAYSSHRSR